MKWKSCLSCLVTLILDCLFWAVLIAFIVFAIQKILAGG